MNTFLIFVILVIIAIAISDLFETIRVCNTNKYEYLKSIRLLENNIKK